MPGFINKERVVFAGGLALLLWEALAFVQGPPELKEPPKPPHGGRISDLRLAAIAPYPSDWKPWDAAARNTFMPRQEFSELPPARLQVPPAPAPGYVSGAPSPRPSAGASTAFRRSADAAEKVDLTPPPPEEED